ncbi:hypothetical protein HHI36_019758 [Cryptolaemus montrouzieri]
MENNSHYVKYKMMDGKHVKIWSCGICGKEFGHQYTLMRHLPTHTDERKFQCNTCGKAFRQMSTLSQHRAIHSSERPYICEVCQKTFNRVSTLISHRKTHTGLKPHRCHLCNKAFHQKGNLRNHIFTHTNERPYKCDICEKGFNQMSNLMCHKLKAHQRADKPKYTCRICGQDFQRRIGLRNHEQHQHGLNQNAVNTPPSPEKLKYSNAIIVDPIKTDAMRLAMQSNKTPFALLRPLSGIPVLVRVIPAGDKQMLIPATADDLKKHGQISIIPKMTTGEVTTTTESGSPESASDSTIVSDSYFSCAACDVLNTSIDTVVEVEVSQEQQGLLNDLLKENARLIKENELYKKLVENMEDKIQLLNFKIDTLESRNSEQSGRTGNCVTSTEVKVVTNSKIPGINDKVSENKQKDKQGQQPPCSAGGFQSASNSKLTFSDTV